jgi:hypothetical protein
MRLCAEDSGSLVKSRDKIGAQKFKFLNRKRGIWLAAPDRIAVSKPTGDEGETRYRSGQPASLWGLGGGLLR